MKNKLIVKGKQEFLGMNIPIIEGGFGEGQKVILAKTVAEIHGVRNNDIQDLINNNINEFEIGIDLLDLCDENFKTDAVGLGFITSNRQKHCYLLSEQGYMLLVGFMKTQKAKEIRKELRREYFKMREVIKNNDRLKADLLLSIYNGGQAGILASKQLRDMEVAEAVAPLNKQIKEDKPFVDLAKERIAKGEKISLTDVTKALGLKRGQISTYFKENGYLHKTQTEVNEKGKEMFGVYKEGHFSCIGILEKGIDFINEHLEEIKQAPTRINKNK